MELEFRFRKHRQRKNRDKSLNYYYYYKAFLVKLLQGHLRSNFQDKGQNIEY